MAWTSVNYACGHTGSEQMYGKATERESRIAWIAGKAILTGGGK